MKTPVTLFSLLLVFPILAACAASPANASKEDLADRQIKAVATTGMIADIVKNIGGERVQVTSLMGPGVDPHLYKASEGDVQSLGEADVIFYNGLHLEAGMARVLERMHDYRRTVAVTDAIDRAMLFTPPEFKGAYDPHVWFDVSLWIQAAETVRDALVEMDPSSAELYRQNADVYLQQLHDLDEYVKSQAERVPESQRVLITAHDAFNYFGRAYGFQVRGLQGISTASEASTGDVSPTGNLHCRAPYPGDFHRVIGTAPQRGSGAGCCTRQGLRCAHRR